MFREEFLRKTGAPILSELVQEGKGTHTSAMILGTGKKARPPLAGMFHLVQVASIQDLRE